MNQILKIAKHNIRMFLMRPWTIVLLFIPILLSMGTQFLFANNKPMVTGKIGIYAQDESKLTSMLKKDLEAAQVEVTYYEDEAKLREDIEGNAIDLGVAMTYDNSYMALKEGQMPYKIILKQEGQVETVFKAKLTRLGQLIQASENEEDLWQIYERIEDGKPVIHTQGEMNQVLTMTISLSFFIMMFLLTAGVGLSPMISERELYVYERMTVAPLRRYQYILGHVLGAFTILFAQMVIQLIGMKLLKVDFNLNSLGFVMIGSVLCVVGIALSLLVFSISKKRTLYYMIMGIGVTPLCMLSDTFFPVELFPAGIEKISYLSPIRWIMISYRGMINNQPLESVISTLAVAILIAIVLILISLIVTSSYHEQA